MPLEAESPQALGGGEEGETKHSGLSLKVTVIS